MDQTNNPQHPQKPTECPHCNSTSTEKHGKRKLKSGEKVQIYFCKNCGKFFTEKRIKSKHYDKRIILKAVSLYNLGYPAKEVIKRISISYKTKLPEQTLRKWLKDLKEICTFLKIRKQALKIDKNMIISKKLNHGQVYNFLLHKPKLEIRKDELPKEKFESLREYLDFVQSEDFPHHIFTIEDEELNKRASSIKAKLLDIEKLRKQNLANKLTELALMLVKKNKERHQVVQNFMITNDSVTVACEVPVYLTKDDIKYFKDKNFVFDFENYRTPITGHIDILQIRNGLVHILDYKPCAEKVNAVNQLTVYALALASRTKLAVKDFKCAWFDEKNYFEFYPLHAVYQKP